MNQTKVARKTRNSQTYKRPEFPPSEVVLTPRHDLGYWTVSIDHGSHHFEYPGTDLDGRSVPSHQAPDPIIAHIRRQTEMRPGEINVVVNL